MKKLFELIQKYLGELMVIIGSGTFSYNIFNFSYKRGEIGRLPASRGGGEFNYIAYYYSSDILLLISIGAMLVAAGILIIKKR